MKSTIDMPNKFRPVKLEVVFETAYELSDFIARLKADNHLPSSVAGLIRQLEAFQDALIITEKKSDGPYWVVKAFNQAQFLARDKWVPVSTDAERFDTPEAAIAKFKLYVSDRPLHLIGWDENQVAAVML